MKKRIVVVGANSALAKELISVLAKQHTVVTAGRKGCDVYCNVAKVVQLPDKVDTVINCAAYFGGQSDEDVREAFQTNVFGALNVCVAAKQAGARMVQISSLSAVLNETSPYYTAYAITKRQADELASFYCRQNEVPLTIIRPSQIYGDSDSFTTHQPFFHELVNRAERGEDIEIYGGNDARRNYIHSSDVAEIIRLVIEKGVTGTYPCMYPADATYSEIAYAALAAFGRSGTVKFLRDKPDTPNNVFPVDTSLYEAVGYHPQVSIEAGLQRIKQWRERNAV